MLSMIDSYPFDIWFLSRNHRADSLGKEDIISEACFAKSHTAREGEIVPGWAILHCCLACDKDGLPEAASTKLPPEYIVSGKGRWAVAGRQTGTAKEKMKIITALIDQLYSRGD